MKRSKPSSLTFLTILALMVASRVLTSVALALILVAVAIIADVPYLGNTSQVIIVGIIISLLSCLNSKRDFIEVYQHLKEKNPIIANISVVVVLSMLDGVSLIALLYSVIQASGENLDSALYTHGGYNTNLCIAVYLVSRTLYSLGSCFTSRSRFFFEKIAWKKCEIDSIHLCIAEVMLGATVPFAGLYMLGEPRGVQWGFLLILAFSVLLSLISGIIKLLLGWRRYKR